MYALSALLHKKLDLYNLKAIELKADGGIICIQNWQPIAPKYYPPDALAEIDKRLPVAFDFMRLHNMAPETAYRSLLGMLQIWELDNNQRVFHAATNSWEAWSTMEETKDGSATLSRGYWLGDKRDELPLVLEPSPYKYETKPIHDWERIYPGIEAAFSLACSLNLDPQETAYYCFKQCFHQHLPNPDITLPTSGLAT